MNKMQKYVIIDCETKPQSNLVDMFNSNIKAPSNIKDEAKIKLAIEKKKEESVKAMSVDTDYAEIFCVGVKELNQEPQLMSIEEFSRYMQGQNGDTTLVTFNGKSFDIPLIIKQGLKKGLKMPYKNLYDCTKRYDNKFGIRHIDLMEVAGQWGSYKSLDTYLQIYLNIAKKEIDFKTCTDEELREHCTEDILNTTKIFNLFKPLIIN